MSGIELEVIDSTTRSVTPETSDSGTQTTSDDV